MPSLTHAVGNFLESIFKFFEGILRSILAVFEHVLHLVKSIVTQIAGLAGDVVKFFMNNIVILGLLFAAFVGYSIMVGNKQGGVAAPNKTSVKKRA